MYAVYVEDGQGDMLLYEVGTKHMCEDVAFELNLSGIHAVAVDSDFDDCAIDVESGQVYGY